MSESEDNAEEAMRRTCNSILAGDYMTPLGDVTPEALNQAMGLGASLTNIPLPESFEIDSKSEIDGEQRFSVRFQAQQQHLTATIGWRQIDGAWKISSIGLDEVAL